MTDEFAMRRALALAARGRGRTAPNPMVGAVVVAGDRIVGRGWHARAGTPHAEVLALQEAGDAARGATLYVTLEPCCHQGRTPPCTGAIVDAGIRRVVASMEDPFSKVSGQGLAALRAAGLQVEGGVLESEARELNRAYLKAVHTGLPWITIKMAMSLDGKIATRTGDSRWVTGEKARHFVQRLRNAYDAVMIGIGTANADDPLLTSRLRGGRDPLRVVVDARAELLVETALVETAPATRTLVFAGKGVLTDHLLARGVEVEHLPLADGRVPVEPMLRSLAARDIHSVLCEGGAALAGALLDAGYVDEVVWFIAPKLVGGDSAVCAIGGRGVQRMGEARDLARVRTRRFGPDLAVLAYLESSPGYALLNAS